MKSKYGLGWTLLIWTETFFLFSCFQRRAERVSGQWSEMEGVGMNVGKLLTACWACPIQWRPRWCPLLCQRCRYGPTPCREKERREGGKKDQKEMDEDGGLSTGKSFPALKVMVARSPTLRPYPPICTWPEEPLCCSALPIEQILSFKRDGEVRVRTQAPNARERMFNSWWHGGDWREHNALSEAGNWE